MAMSPTVRTVAMKASFRLAQDAATDVRKSFCAVRPRSSLAIDRSTSQQVARPHAIDSAGFIGLKHLTGWFSPISWPNASVDRASQGSFPQPLEQVRASPGSIKLGPTNPSIKSMIFHGRTAIEPPLKTRKGMVCDRRTRLPIIQTPAPPLRRSVPDRRSAQASRKACARTAAPQQSRAFPESVERQSYRPQNR
jgi:hypothetical protein